MKKYKEYLLNCFSSHSHLAITIRILECLEHIELNIKTIAPHAGQSAPLRHPTNHLAFHVADFPTAEIAEEHLLKLVNEVRGCFKALLALEDQARQFAYMDTFLLNITDSAVGCMEARLRPALIAQALCFSSGCRSIHELAHQFTIQLASDTITIEDVLDFFSEKVEHYLPVRSKEDSIETLHWALVKNYLKDILCYDNIEEEWTQYKKKLDHLIVIQKIEIVKNRGWFFYNAKDPHLVRRYLSYVKSFLPDYAQDLAKAAVQFNPHQSNDVYSFRLTHEQHAAFESLIVSSESNPASVSDNLDVDTLLNAELEALSQAPLFRFSDLSAVELSLEQENYCFAFLEKTGAEEMLCKIKKYLHGTSSLDTTEIKCSDSKLHFYFLLTRAQWEILRQRVRSHSKALIIDKDFILKSIRADENNYIRSFIAMTSHEFKRLPLRTQAKRAVTVTGSGIFTRNAIASDSMHRYKPKTPQYSPEQKKHVSKAMSATLGLPDFHPHVFGHQNRADNLVGVMFLNVDTLKEEGANVLLSDRLFIYDTGTVTRNMDYDDYVGAENYFCEKVGKVLFGKADVEKFKQAIKENSDKYNEILVRLAWSIDNNSQIFIASDTLEARLTAQDYARIIKTYLLDHHLCTADYTIPICFYCRGQSILNFKPYTVAEQQLDQIEAQFICGNQNLLDEKYKAKHYEFILGIPASKIKIIFQKHYFIINLLYGGYVHIVHSLLEKVTPEEKQELMMLLKEKLQSPDHASKVCNILYHCLRVRAIDLANAIIPTENISTWSTNSIKDGCPLLKAAKEGFEKWVEIFMDDGGVDFKNPAIIIRALNYAASNGHIQVLLKLLPYKKMRTETYRASECIPLHHAVDGGHIEAVRLLLQFGVSVNGRGADACSALMLAVIRGHFKIAQALLAYSECDVNEENFYRANSDSDLQLRLSCDHIGYYFTALICAVRLGRLDMVNILLEHPDMNIYRGQCKRGILWEAADKAYLNIFLKLTEHSSYSIRGFGNRQNYEAWKHLIDKFKEDKPNLDRIEGAIKKAMQHYIQLKEETPSLTRYSSIFGVDPKIKLAAAKALLENITHPTAVFSDHKNAISNGELGRFYSLLVKLSEAKCYVCASALSEPMGSQPLSSPTNN